MSTSQSVNPSYSHRIPAHLWLGVVILLAGEVLMVLQQRFVIEWFTPIMWTGYILAIDGWLFKRSGASWLKNHLKEFLFLLVASVGIWVIFEVFNFHLQNWYYLSVPTSPVLRLISYFWSFATIIPGVFLTAQILESFLPAINGSVRNSRELGSRGLWFVVGLAMVLLPVAVPQELARYLFGSVWIGFILMIDPINEQISAPSIRDMLDQGNSSKIIALMVGGFVCGLLWEAWNYQAFLNDGGHWIYTVPQAFRIFGLHYGQMPLLGMLGFPPFALELYALYHFFREMIEGTRLLGPYYW